MIALERGAFDFVSKPSGPISLDLHKVKVELIQKVKLAYQAKGRLFLDQSKTEITSQAKPVKLKTLLEKDKPRYEKEIKTDFPPIARKMDSGLNYVIVIGTSTGGPKALQQVLTSLRYMKQAAIVIVQHMPPAFTKSLANRLNQITDHHVREAENGELLRGGHVYIAPGGYHMELKSIHKQLAIYLHDGAARSGHRPSVDVLLESVANVKGFEIISLIMTGMGKDGTEGLKKLTNQRKVYSIAEDESSCIVYGMPRSVIEAKLVDEICPLDQIHLAIERLIKE
jgi:two-component system chemotaxis response regulator CheB